MMNANAMNNTCTNYTNTNYARYNAAQMAPAMNGYAQNYNTVARTARPAMNGYAANYNTATARPAMNGYAGNYNTSAAAARPAMNGYAGNYNTAAARPAMNGYAPNYNTAQAAAPIRNNMAQKAASTGYSTCTLIGIAMAAIASVLGVLGIFGSSMFPNSTLHFNSFWAMGLLLGLVSYVLAGGIKHAVKGAWGVAKFAWFVVPVFPIDLIIGLCGLVLGVMVFTSVPIIFVLKGANEKRRR